jgi:Neuraminidase (sialidase)
MSLEKFAQYIKAKRDPKLWNDFIRKIKGYQKWTHGSLPKNVTIEVVDKPGVSGLWMTYDAGTVPESAYIMPKGSKRKGAWKHPWDTHPRIKHDPDAGIIMHKLSGRSKVTDFYHK